MGGGNPIRQIVNAASDVVLAPVRETARAVGATGIVDAAEGIKAGVANGVQQVGDLITNEGGKREEEYRSRVGTEQAVAGEAAVAEERRQVAATNSEAETARMAAGSRSRTLLTSPRGLLDDDKKTTISRRTLSAR